MLLRKNAEHRIGLESVGVNRAIRPCSGRAESAPADSLTAERASPQKIAETLAEMKALRVSARHGAAMVVGADSTLACNGRR